MVSMGEREEREKKRGGNKGGEIRGKVKKGEEEEGERAKGGGRGRERGERKERD